MSLRVWLPLNGDLHNQGIGGETATMMGTGITWTAGKIGTAATFPNSCSSCIHISGLKLQTLSWACWFKCVGEGSGSSQRILSEGRDTGSVGTNIWLSKAGTTLYWTAHKVTGSTTVSLNTWYHVVLVCDGSKVHLYLNGEEKGTGTAYSADSDYAQSNDKFVIGKMAYSYTSTSNYFPFNGQVNDVRIYDHALSVSEIHEIAQGLVLHYKLDNNGQGGRNLMRKGTGTFHNTDKLTTITWSGWDSYNSLPLTDIDWNSHYGDYITYSCYMENVEQTAGTGSGIMLHFRYADGTYQQFGGGKNGASGQYLAQGESGWLRLTVAIPNASTRSNPTTIARVEASVRHNSSGGASTIRYQYPQVEYGNKQTAWSWAPEDTGDDPARIEDSSGYNYNGTIIGNPIVDSDTIRYSSCTSFPTNTDGILSTFPLTLWNNAFTYSFWIKPSGDNGRRSIYAASYNGTSCSIEKTAGNKLRFYWAGSPDLTTSSLTITDGVWQHIAIVKSEDKTKVYCYYNGELKDTFTNTFSDKTFSGSLCIARDTRGDATSYTGLMSDFRIYCTPLLDTDIKQLYNVGMRIDKFGNMHPFGVQENYDMIINTKFVNNSATSVSYDEKTDTYTIVSPIGTSSWGYGVRLADTPALMVPYGATYRWTAEVWTPIALNINTDYNNTAGGTDVNWAGNDNDATGTRLASIIAIPANKWTRIYRGASNTNNGNTNHLPIRDYSSLGLVTNGQSNPVTWKVRHLQWYIADTEFKPQIKSTGIFEASHFTETENDLNKPAQISKKMFSVNATQFIER